MTTNLPFTHRDWNKYAKYYDEALLALRPYQELVRCVQGHVPSGLSSVMDAGCGTGTLLAQLRHVHPDSRLIGIDRSWAMLDRAAAKLGDSVQLIWSTLDAFIQSRREPCAGLVSCNVLYATPDPEAFLRQVYKCLQPEGRFVIANPKRGFDNGLILKAHCGDTRPDAFWCNPHSTPEREKFLIREAFGDGETAAAMMFVAHFNRRIAADSNFHFFTDDELVRLCEQVGLRVTSLERQYAQQTQVVAGYKGGLSK